MKQDITPNKKAIIYYRKNDDLQTLRVMRNNVDLDFHSGFCRTFANAKAPTYICKDPFMCKPEEFSLAITALGQNAAEYNHCMYKKGYNVK